MALRLAVGAFVVSVVEQLEDIHVVQSIHTYVLTYYTRVLHKHVLQLSPKIFLDAIVDEKTTLTASALLVLLI